MAKDKAKPRPAPLIDQKQPIVVASEAGEIRSAPKFVEPATSRVLVEPNDPPASEKVELKRKDRHKRAFDEAVAAVAELFPLEELLSTEPSEAARVLSLDARRVAAPAALTDTVGPPNRLNWLHAEVLLDQAADLLDRALSTRQVFEETAQKMFTLLLELNEYVALDRIHLREEQAGLYEVPFQLAEAEYLAEFRSGFFNGNTADLVQQSANEAFTGEAWVRLWTETARGAMTNGALPYRFEDQDFDGYVSHNWYERDQIIPHHSVDSATEQLEHSARLQFETMINQSGVFRGIANVSNTRADGLEAQRNWSSQNRFFLRERTNVARRFQDAKMRAATLPDGVLNHSRRLPGLRQRFEDDVRAALVKLESARKGLEQVFGFAEALPIPGADDYLDQLTRWTRTAIQWLLAFIDRDQSMVLPLSLRELVGEEAWVQGAAAGTWLFRFDPDFFPELAHVRLRGLSLLAVPRTDIERKCGAVSRLYRFEVNAPVVGQSRHRSSDLVEVDQSLVRPIVLARVTTRDHARDPDVAGTSALHNVCPCGDWRVTLIGGLPTNGLRADLLVDLADVHLDLHLVYSRVGED